MPQAEARGAADIIWTTRSAVFIGKAMGMMFSTHPQNGRRCRLTWRLISSFNDKFKSRLETPKNGERSVNVAFKFEKSVFFAKY